MFYTRDFFHSVSLLRENLIQCLFAHSTEHFHPSVSKDHVFCVAYGDLADFDTYGIMESDTDFREPEACKNELDSMDIPWALGASSITIAKQYILITIKARVWGLVYYEKTDFLISKDGVHWMEAAFSPAPDWEAGTLPRWILELRNSLAIITLPSHGGTFYVWNNHTNQFGATLDHISTAVPIVFQVDGSAFTYTYHAKTSSVHTVATFDDGFTWSRLSLSGEHCNSSRSEPCCLLLNPFL